MGKILTIAGQKGGSGKTAMAVNLAASLALLEKKTLLVDTDPHACSSNWLCRNPDGSGCDLAGVLSARIRFTDAIGKTELPGLDLIPSGSALLQAGLKLSPKSENEKILRLFLADIQPEYDFILVDAPSSYGFLSRLSIAAADQLLVCMAPDSSSVDDFKCLLALVTALIRNHDLALKIAGIVFNRCPDARAIQDFMREQDLLDAQSMICRTFIPDDPVLARARERFLPAALLDVKSPAAQAYLAAAQEVNAFFDRKGAP